MRYIKQVSTYFACMTSFLLLLVVFMMIATWDFPSLDRIWHDGTKSMLRVIVLMSAIIPLILRIKISFKIN